MKEEICGRRYLSQNLTGNHLCALQQAACKTVAVFLHYFNLVSFTWMLLEGIWLYLMIVRVFESGHSRMKKYCASAWGKLRRFILFSTISRSLWGCVNLHNTPDPRLFGIVWTPIQYVTLHLRRRASSLPLGNRAKITVLMCEQNPYLV